MIVKLTVLALKQLTRHRLRTLLTAAGVATAMFLFASVETLQVSLRKATDDSEANTLVVYRENRFCPATSHLPEHYLNALEEIPGVASVIPIQIAVNNCGASLDVITFRGVPPEDLTRYNPDLEITEGSAAAWIGQTDGALLGEHFARRRALKVGDRFEAVGVNVLVSGIMRSPHPQDNNVAYVHLPFLQQASKSGLGSVTQFNVRLEPGSDPQSVATAIDEKFESDSQPTSTQPETAFFEAAARQLIELIGFTRWLALGAVIVVLTLVANAITLIVRSRVRENAVLRTLGYESKHIGTMVAVEGILLGLVGGLIGVAAAMLFLHLRAFTFGNEGLTLAVRPDFPVLIRGLAVAVSLGLLASLYPAWKASRLPIVSSLRDA